MTGDRYSPPVKSSRRRIRWVLIALPLAAVVLLIAAGALLVAPDPLEGAEAVVLLSGGDEVRQDEAIRLIRDGYAKYLILTDTGEQVDGSQQAYLDLITRELIDQGIPADAILFTRQAADSTREEAGRVKDVLRQYRLGSAIVVTDPYHTLRVRWIYRSVFSGGEEEIIVRAARDHWYRPLTWWLRPEGWKVTGLEYAKLLADVFLR